MLPREKIEKYLQDMPPALQAEVVSFIEYLMAKAVREEAEHWSNLSLSHALRGMENEETPEYGLSDIKIPFS